MDLEATNRKRAWEQGQKKLPREKRCPKKLSPEQKIELILREIKNRLHIVAIVRGDASQVGDQWKLSTGMLKFGKEFEHVEIVLKVVKVTMRTKT